VIAGLDPATNKPFICSTDLIGCINLAEDFVVAGTCSPNLYGMCESLYKPNLVRTTKVFFFLSCLSVFLGHRSLKSCLRQSHRQFSTHLTETRSAVGVPLSMSCIKSALHQNFFCFSLKLVTNKYSTPNSVITRTLKTRMD